MNLKLVIAVSLYAAIPMVAYAQQKGPAANAPKPTVADVQKLVQSISGDKAKLKTYCDIGKLQEQMEQAEQKKTPRRAKLLALRPTTSQSNLALITKKSWAG